ncbi:hypothetical protein GCM10027456_48390 [Kineosporia babensis]
MTSNWRAVPYEHTFYDDIPPMNVCPCGQRALTVYVDGEEGLQLIDADGNPTV